MTGIVLAFVLCVVGILASGLFSGAETGGPHVARVQLVATTRGVHGDASECFDFIAIARVEAEVRHVIFPHDAIDQRVTALFEGEVQVATRRALDA